MFPYKSNRFIFYTRYNLLHLLKDLTQAIFSLFIFFLFAMYFPFFSHFFLIKTSWSQTPFKSSLKLCKTSSKKLSFLRSPIPLLFFFFSLSSLQSGAHFSSCNAFKKSSLQFFLEHNILLTTQGFWKWFSLTTTKFFWMYLLVIPHLFHVFTQCILLNEGFFDHAI